MPRKPGPPKRQVLVRLLESTARRIEKQIEPAKLPTYLSEKIEATHGDHWIWQPAAEADTMERVVHTCDCEDQRRCYDPKHMEIKPIPKPSIESLPVTPYAAKLVAEATRSRDLRRKDVQPNFKKGKK